MNSLLQKHRDQTEFCALLHPVGANSFAKYVQAPKVWDVPLIANEFGPSGRGGSISMLETDRQATVPVFDTSLPERPARTVLAFIHYPSRSIVMI
jgi:hypothetical protein